MIKKQIAVFVSCFLLLLTGCWDKVEIEDLAYVIAIGLDMAEGENLVITYQIANPEGGEGDTESEIISIQAPDFLSARDLAVSFASREVVFTHANVLVISEEIARTDKLLNFVQPAITDRQLRRDLHVLISKEKAAEYIHNNQPTLETSPHRYFYLISKRWQETGLVPDSTLHQLFQRTEEDSGLFLATYSTTVNGKEKYPEDDEDQEENSDGEDKNKKNDNENQTPGDIEKWGGNPTQTIGSAVIKKGKMIGTLTGEETRTALLLRPDQTVKKVITTFQDPIQKEFNISARLLTEEASQISIDTSNKYPAIVVKTPIHLEILSIGSDIDYVENLENQAFLKKHIKKTIEKNTNDFIKRTQKEFRAEPFRWGLVARRNFHTMEDYMKYNWIDKYAEAEIDFEADVQLKEFGKQLKPPKQGKVS